ncbi:molybdopterin converting factor [Cohnella endophytica]|uniref:Molybdopterin synthase catalytic subunit n=1 Tax=Cohnella endophytica TaxID=2419778 RepID=A0A494XYQ5_9BACL|nr:molybdenum cofactor biosynthesis protein MoaE [Cohnella endophytica]RKP54179.1 molybdopterin converting factor [Cohnella endophytica]
MANRWTIALFAGLAERFGTRSLQPSWEHESLTAGQLKRLLAEQFPEHADLLAICFVARNQAYANDEAIVESADELALLPPVSGGSGDSDELDPVSGSIPRYWISDKPLDTGEALARVYHPDHGAAIAFVGTTREWTQGKRTVTLQYEAYVPMAESALARIGDEIGERWPGTLCAIAHRIGTVGIGEISVVIAVSSAHRADAYDASRYAIERLKQVVPIWKKEVYEDGTEWKGHQLGPWDPTTSLE